MNQAAIIADLSADPTILNNVQAYVDAQNLQNQTQQVSVDVVVQEQQTRPVSRAELNGGFVTVAEVEAAIAAMTNAPMVSLADQLYDEFVAACNGTRAEYTDSPRTRNGHVKAAYRRQFRRACAKDTGTTFGLSEATIVMALIVGVLGGPMGLVLAICICLFEYFFSKDLDRDLEAGPVLT